MVHWYPKYGAAGGRRARPAVEMDEPRARGGKMPNARKPAASTAPDGAARAPAADSLTPEAGTAPVPKKARGGRPPRADRSPALPRREDDVAAAPSFRPTGALIVELRKRCGFSVAEFAELLRVSGTTVRRWEAVPGPLDLRAGSREALRVLRLEIDRQA